MTTQASSSATPTYITFVKGGQTDMVIKEGKWQGPDIDTHIDKDSEKSAHEFAVQLFSAHKRKNEDKTNVDVILCGRLLRCSEPAQIFQSELQKLYGQTIEVKEDERLNERNINGFSGLENKQVLDEFNSIFKKEGKTLPEKLGSDERFEKEYVETVKKADAKYSKIEDNNQLRDRMNKLCLEIGEQYKGKNVVAITCTDPLRVLYRDLKGIPMSQNLKTSAFTTLTIKVENGQLSFVSSSDIANKA